MTTPEWRTTRTADQIQEMKHNHRSVLAYTDQRQLSVTLQLNLNYH